MLYSIIIAFHIITMYMYLGIAKFLYGSGLQWLYSGVIFSLPAMDKTIQYRAYSQVITILKSIHPLPCQIEH